MRSRRLSPSIAGLLAMAALASSPALAAAQYPPPPPPPNYTPPPPPGYTPGPPPGTFVPRVTGALRLGMDIPGGDAFKGMPLSELFDSQFGIQGELGVLVNPHLMLGGYLAFGFGGTGSYYHGGCGGSCGAFAFRTGLMAQYTFAPSAPVTPWIGYGFGFTSAFASNDDYYSYSPFSQSYYGFDLGHFMAGVDFKPIGHGGIGIFVDYTVGMYTAYHWDEYDVTIADGWLHDPTFHYWISFGPRISF